MQPQTDYLALREIHSWSLRYPKDLKTPVRHQQGTRSKAFKTQGCSVMIKKSLLFVSKRFFVESL